MGALQDFMLRLLLVCAVISIVFDMAFAEDNSHRKTGTANLRNKIYYNILTTITDI